MTESKQKIAILGCGWLGLALGEHLVQEGYNVNGSTTSEEKLAKISAKGINPFQIKVINSFVGKSVDKFFDASVLVLNIPPKRRQENIENVYPQQVKLIVDKAIKNGVQKVLFTSSTSVYGNVMREVDELESLEGTTASAKALITVEEYLQSHPIIETTILRLGGLVGGERKAGRFLAGRKDIPNGDAPVNLVHRDDCIAIISKLIEKDKWGVVFNVCADKHPTRKAFYTAQARRQGFEAPHFLAGATAYKIVTNDLVKKTLDYRFIHPDPMAF